MTLVDNAAHPDDVIVGTLRARVAPAIVAKLNRERKLLERRQAKQAKKAARKQAAADQRGGPSATLEADSSP